MPLAPVPFFPEFEAPRPTRSLRPKKGAPNTKDRPAKGKAPTYPCEGCPCNDGRLKIEPIVPVGAPLIACVGMRPAAEEERQGRPFVGTGSRPINDELDRNGVDRARVFFSNLLRCNPKDISTKQWGESVKHCWKFLEADIDRLPPDVPLVLFGKETLKQFLGAKERIEARRGLWTLYEGRPTFVARHPARDADNPFLQEQFRKDMKRMADKVFGKVPKPDIRLSVYPSPQAAAPFLAGLARAGGPWAFDIESYDGKAYPARRDVSTDPCHPDFRLRGIAFALGPNEGAWVDCLGWESRLDEARALLEPVFTSEAEKWAFNGSFDEEGLVYPGWTSAVSRRTGDGMLSMVALGDGTHASLKLEKAVVEILQQPQYWLDADKSKMRDIPLQEVAENAVGDACYTWQLTNELHQRLERGEYLAYDRGEGDESGLKELQQ